MNWRSIRAIVRRDLVVAAGTRSVALPTVVVPLLLLVVAPALAGTLPRLATGGSYQDLAPLLDLLPDQAVGALPGGRGERIAVVLVVYLLSPVVLLVPVLFAAVLAADGVAGERERGTLEGLLLTPVSDRDLAVAKLLAAWLPALALGLVGGALYATVANLTVGRAIGQLVLPTPEFAVMVLWVGPAFSAVALGAVLLVSARVGTTQEAFQLGAVAVLPVIAMLVSQASGALLLSPWLLGLIGLAGAVVAVVVVALATRSLARDRLGPRLG